MTQDIYPLEPIKPSDEWQKIDKLVKQAQDQFLQIEPGELSPAAKNHCPRLHARGQGSQTTNGATRQGGIMANEQNLIPNEARTPEERRENARKAGIASGIARRKKRTLREIAEEVGNMELKNPKLLAIMHEAGFHDPITNDDAAQFGLLLRAQKGDPAANKLMAELRGQYSTRVEVEPVQPKPLIDLTEGKK